MHGIERAFINFRLFSLTPYPIPALSFVCVCVCVRIATGIQGWLDNTQIRTYVHTYIFYYITSSKDKIEKSRKCWWVFDTSSDSIGAELSGIKLMAFDYLDRVDQLKDGRDSDFRFGVGPFADRSISWSLLCLLVFKWCKWRSLWETSYAC